MAEQDKPSLVPAVLNDLMDVDGTAVEGQQLIHDGTVWVPSAGPVGLPAINVYTGSGSTFNAMLAATARDPGYTSYPGTHPEFGTMVWDTSRSALHWCANAPGLYRCYLYFQCNNTGTPVNIDSTLAISQPMSGMTDAYWGAGDTETLVRPQSSGYFSVGWRWTEQITQALIDTPRSFAPAHRGGWTWRSTRLPPQRWLDAERMVVQPDDRASLATSSLRLLGGLVMPPCGERVSPG